MESSITVPTTDLAAAVSRALCFTRNPKEKNAASYTKVVYLARDKRKLYVFSTDGGAAVWLAIPASIVSGEGFGSFVEVRQARSLVNALRRSPEETTLFFNGNDLVASNKRGDVIWKSEPTRDERLSSCLYVMDTISASITNRANHQLVAHIDWKALRSVACQFDRYDNPFLVLRSDVRDGFTAALWTTEKRLTNTVVVGQGKTATFIPIDPRYACCFESSSVRAYRDTTTDWEIWQFQARNAIMKVAQVSPHVTPAWQRWRVNEISLNRVSYTTETRQDVPTAEFLSREQVEELNRKLQEIFPQVTYNFMRRWGQTLNYKCPEGARLIVDDGQIFIVYQGPYRNQYPASLIVDLRAAITPALKEMVYNVLLQKYGHPCAL